MNRYDLVQWKDDALTPCGRRNPFAGQVGTIVRVVDEPEDLYNCRVKVHIPPRDLAVLMSSGAVEWTEDDVRELCPGNVVDAELSNLETSHNLTTRAKLDRNQLMREVQREAV